MKKIISMLLCSIFITSNVFTVFGAETVNTKIDEDESGYNSFYAEEYDKGYDDGTVYAEIIFSTYQYSIKENKAIEDLNIKDYNKMGFEQKGIYDGEDIFFDIVNMDSELLASIDFENMSSMSKLLNDYLEQLDIEKEFDLDEFTDEEIEEMEDNYKEGFYSGFTELYREKVNADEIRDPEQVGEMFGQSYGSVYAMRDYFASLPMNVERVYRQLPLTFFYNRFELDRFDKYVTKDFVQGFKNGFKAAYEEGYLSAYEAEKNLDVNYINLYLNGIQFEFTDFNQQVIQGSVEDVSLPSLAIDIDDNTFYDNYYLGVYKDYNRIIYDDGQYKLISDPYILSIFNPETGNKLTEVDMYKPIKIKFNSIDNDRAGIYKYENGEWKYQFTEFEDDYLVTTVDGDKFGGGVYALMIDFNYPIVTDINLSWAYEELYTYLRRGYITPNANGKYNPKANITRGEFANLIYENSSNKIYMPINKTFTDEQLFGKYKTAIEYCYSRGFMYGTGENTFGVNEPLTYNEVEIIMSRILGYDFNYNVINDSMVNDKYKKSKALNGKNQYIPRDEAVYMFSYLYN